MRTETYAPVVVLEESTDPLAAKEPDAVGWLRKEIILGKPWHEALIQAMGLWTHPSEKINGREYLYVVQGEAFDWMLLAERLCVGLKDIIPLDELDELLFHGRLPVRLDTTEIKNALGYNKYRGILNFWYGVVVEEALQLTVEDEVRKEVHASGRTDMEDLSDAAFRRLYDADSTTLVERFQEEAGYVGKESVNLAQIKELTYWLFKLRLKYWDPARVASDTRKGLKALQQLRHTTQPI